VKEMRCVLLALALAIMCTGCGSVKSHGDFCRARRSNPNRSAHTIIMAQHICFLLLHHLPDAGA
jgi:hypothetical protein